jgi:hypothetical protein
MKHRDSEVTRGRWTTSLIGDYPQLWSLLAKAKHGLHEILTMAAEDPRRTHDDVAVELRSHDVLAGELAFP